MIQHKIAIVSDIHGNSFALKEVMKDIKSRGIDAIVDLGDSLYGPLDPKGTFDLLIENNVVSISGNQDRFIRENLNRKSDVATLEYVKSQIDKEVTDWLKSLSFDKIINEMIYCCHASPQSDSIYLLEDIREGYVAVKGNSQLDKLLKHIHQKIVVCGHSHVTRVVETGQKIIINPGSVGLPAYDDDSPMYHKMENFSPAARYIVLNPLKDKFVINQISVEYDSEKAAKMAESNNRMDWAKWIRTGRT